MLVEKSGLILNKKTNPDGEFLSGKRDLKSRHAQIGNPKKERKLFFRIYLQSAPSETCERGLQNVRGPSPWLNKKAHLIGELYRARGI